ncbi:MAG: glycosyltransferase [Gammaproteobacteria bacterium]
MNILILTNTYIPHVGGVARSVAAFSEEYRARGHEVLIVAPEFPDMPENERGVIRVHAIQNFNASDFSVVLPTMLSLDERIDAFDPDLVHSQHPFLLGTSAVRIARRLGVPLVFTHHTRYERYTHYVPGDSPALKRFVIELATRYANLCDLVFAPSESVRQLLEHRGVTAPIKVVPTGVRPELFARGDGAGFRSQTGIPDDAFVVGHLGRLAPEKNLEFLAESVAGFAADDSRVHFLVVGNGPSEDAIRATFARAGLEQRLHHVGVLQQQALSDALHAMDLFAFASTSETQGMVLTEAMAAALPVVALEAPGASEVVTDRHNGRLLPDADPHTFAGALAWVAGLPDSELSAMRKAALATAERFSMTRSADKALDCFAALQSGSPAAATQDESAWEELLKAIKAEWNLLQNIAGASDAALNGRSPAGEVAEGGIPYVPSSGRGR